MLVAPLEIRPASTTPINLYTYFTVFAVAKQVVIWSVGVQWVDDREAETDSPI